jgi:hypothetical protein
MPSTTRARSKKANTTPKKKDAAASDASDDVISKKYPVDKSHFDLKFLLSRGASSFFFLIPHAQAYYYVHHDQFARWFGPPSSKCSVYPFQFIL